MSDIIAALSTPAGISALAIIRVSGKNSLSLLQALSSRQEWKPQQAVHCVLSHHNHRLDDVVAIFWKGPRSFTGEDSFEISCHGNPLICQKILSALLDLGARLAEPGEFTQRAFLNGRLDLTQAEAILDVIHASTDHALLGAQAMQKGELGAHLQSMRTELINLLAHLEAFIDFPDEDIQPETGAAFQKKVLDLFAQTESLLATAPLGRILREGVPTAIVGEPNVGKSSLLNYLLRENRAIVSATPGTTRDTIEAECVVRGLQLRLIDTAGQRSTDDDIELEGIRRAKLASENARLILHVVEAHQPPHIAEEQFISHKPGQTVIRVANKSDLGIHPERHNCISVSTRTGAGFEVLEEKIETALLKGTPREQENWLTLNARHESVLKRAAESLRRALGGLKERLDPELISVDLRAALGAIGEVVGIATNEDILDQLFKSFCIGK